MPPLFFFQPRRPPILLGLHFHSPLPSRNNNNTIIANRPSDCPSDRPSDLHFSHGQQGTSDQYNKEMKELLTTLAERILPPQQKPQTT